MNYVEQCASGEHEGVWLALAALRESELDTATLSDVEAVTLETIRRVKLNLESIAAKLKAMGYVFGEIEENGKGFYGDKPKLWEHPIIKLEKDATRLMTETSSVVGGSVPLVYRIFAEVSW